MHDDGSNKTIVADIIVHLQDNGWRTVVVSWFNQDAVLYFMNLLNVCVNIAQANAI